MFDRFLGEPSVSYCEEAVGEIVKRPGYAVSNLAYFVLGIYLFAKYPKSNLAKAFALLSISIGTFSMFYDVFDTYLTQLVDLGGMFAFVGLLLFLNVNALTKANKKLFLLMYTPLILFGYYLIDQLGGHAGQVFFGSLVVSSIISELYLQRTKHRSCVKYWCIAFGIYVVSFLVWLLDASKILCDPNNIFNGRGVYHYMTAFVIYFLFIHYSSQNKKA